MTPAEMVANAIKQTTDSKNKGLLQYFNERGMPITDRAQAIIYEITEYGLDYVPAISQILADRDESGQMTEMVKKLGEEPLVTERYLGPAKLNAIGSLACAITGVKYAWVTTKDGVGCMPCDIPDLVVGDLVAISPRASRIVARDGDLTSTGVVATIESLPPGGKQAVIKIGDLMQVAWLHHKLLANLPEIGARVIYDDRHRFVLDHANTDTDAKEMLAELDSLPIVHRDQVGSPNEEALMVINHFQDAIEHPEWLEKLGSRDRKGYLFIGSTGGGKSYHIKLIATEIHDMVEKYTGSRQGRVLICDASQFWSPYFGETEQRINTWAKKLQKLGSMKVKGKDGEEVAVPLMVVVEECEALFRSRGGDQHASGHLFDRVLSLLLQKLESAEDAIHVPIVWVCSTNRPDLVDAAAMRRIGMRKVIFGNLDAEATFKVMMTKLANHKVDAEKVANQVTNFLHLDEKPMAEVGFQGGKKRPLFRKDLVTPAVLEEAVSSAVDRCLDASRKEGKLQKIATADITDFLDRHYNHLAGILTAENLPEHCPAWFAEDNARVIGVKPVR